MANDTPQLSHAKEPVCGDCVHCMPGPNTKDDILSRNCYRYPPVPHMAEIPGKGIVVISVRPEIRVETIACGEFETAEDDDVPSPGLTS